MAYDQRPNQPRTDTTRHLDSEETSGYSRGVVNYLEGARQRSTRFAQTSAQLRTIRKEIDVSGREAHNRPTGVLSGGDVDIVYHYMGLAFGIVAALYSVVGTIFAFLGGGSAVVEQFLQRWAVGPATAFSETLFNLGTLGAVTLQAVLFVVIIGTRRNPRSWQHAAAIITSALFTYAGWSSLIMASASAPLAAITLTVPAALIGGALAWLAVRSISETPPSRNMMIGVVAAGVLVGVLGSTTLLHGIGLLLGWSADQVARRIMVIG